MVGIVPESMGQLLPSLERPHPDWLESARKAISEGTGHSLYKEFWGLCRQAGGDKSATAKEAMLTLEQLWDHDQFVAGYLMALLLTDASSASRHDVVDAIWLYLDSASSKELGAALERITVTRGRKSKQSKFASVVSKIKAKGGL